MMAGANPQATYYPDANSLKEAEIIDVQSGFMVENLDFQLLHRFGGKLSGRVKADMKTLGERTATITGGKLEDLIETPVHPDGRFEFGHVPPGAYLVSLYPPTPGIASYPIKVGNEDVSGVELVPLPVHTVKGRIVSKNGPLPRGILGFFTTKTYVGAKIDLSGAFTVQLHSAMHQIDVAGLPVGYSLASVKIGAQDATRGLRVQDADISDVVITVNAPQHLAKLKGQITGIAPERMRLTTITLAGPVVGILETVAKPDGSFEFPTVVPGLYTLALPEVETFKPIDVVLDSPDTFTVSVAVPSR
jgi:hypothetical protein